jgi:arylsulfatase A-like enzyme
MHSASNALRSWTRAAALASVLLVGLFRATAAEAPRPSLLDRVRVNTRPNIVFILADDLGYGDLGCYGQTRIETPNLDRLAAAGMRFTQCYAGSTVCAPSRASLLTGLHTGHVLIRGNATVPLRAEDLTVAEVLQRAGYKTGAFGKWGLGLAGSTGTPNRKGFDEWLGYLSQTHAHDYYPTQLYRNDLLLVLDRNLYGNKGQYSHDLFSLTASNFVRVNKYFSFFLYLAYTIPHANNELGRKTGNGMEVPSDEPYSRQPWPQPEKNKAAMITRLDRDVGALVSQLKALRLETNTVIFFTSDNGPHKEGGVTPAFLNSSGPLRGIKRDLYEGGIRVPMIVSWPGHVPAGVVSDQVWAFWDFLATAADVAGLPPPPGTDGISMLPTLLGRKQTNQHEFLYWEFHERGSKQAVRMGDWKAVRPEPGRPLELFNLKADPAETTDLAAQHPQVVARMEDYLRTARTESARWPLRTAQEAAQVKPEPAEPN